MDPLVCSIIHSFLKHRSRQAADRVAQTVVAMELEKRVEPMFHPDSYGYRPRRSALGAGCGRGLLTRPDLLR
ncbi:hypothetical protein [Candidatus Mycobacterium methanotrophicum]|uniref:Uncharacterized protein n=2 Tax=Candidatus Mycobacterium methanotrophicum TaxID=2943498 RepID=A0ABY4QIH8_9MYCO|nr:hypothetical protein [Candidatus Mycobacterium methanotrophicum]UQX09796.1 hypothetical protein M5I08_16025 [Candidatus Mycobacterium methanotrophicum]